MPDNGYMRVLNDEIPDPDDFDAGREQENDDPTALPGMLSAPEMERIRSLIPIPYIVAIPVKTDDSGKITEVGTLLCADDDGNVVRTVVSGRVLYGETLRESIMRHMEKDLGAQAFPVLPPSILPFTVAEFFPSPSAQFCDPRQHAIALCYVVPVSGLCNASDETLEIDWIKPEEALNEQFLEQIPNGFGRIVRHGLMWADAL